jgi:hypothetical protein
MLVICLSVFPAFRARYQELPENEYIRFIKPICFIVFKEQCHSNNTATLCVLASQLGITPLVVPNQGAVKWSKGIGFLCISWCTDEYDR